MNEIFSYKRFGKLFVNDIKRYLPKSYGTILIFLGILPAIWTVKSLLELGGPMASDSRLAGILILAFICTFISIFRIYGTTNHKKKGVEFTMLPASALEKFLSMTLLATVALPIAFLLISFLLDCLMAFIPTGAYEGFIGIQTLFSAETLLELGKIMLFMCFALCGNMLFRKAKLTKTVFSLFALSVVFAFIISFTIYHTVKHVAYQNEQGEILRAIDNAQITPENLDEKTILIEKYRNEENNKEVKITRNGRTYIINKGSMNRDAFYFLEDHYSLLYTLFNIFIYVIIPGAMYFITYHKIKTQQL